MRKQLIICLIISILGINLSVAQVPKSISFKPGITLTNQLWDDDGERYMGDKIKVGVYFAVNLEFFHHKYLSLLTETGLSAKMLYQSGYDKSLDYWFFAPLIKFRYEFGNFIPSIHLGPRADYLLTDTYELKNLIGVPPTNKWVYGITYGLELDYNLKKMTILAGSNFQQDISDAAAGNGTSFKNCTYAIYLGIKVYFKKKDKQSN